MPTASTRWSLTIAAVVLATLAAAARAEIVTKTEAWDRTSDGFEAFAQRIQDFHGRNLLARRHVKVLVDAGVSDGLRELFDGRAGSYGADGRVMINGQPTTINVYLGGLKTITEIGAFTCNIDTRANQDFEVRVADNSRSPGTAPDFQDSPVLTTGAKILGSNGGGFLTRFVESAGGPLVPGQVDWIQFRIWRTYPITAGEAAHHRDTTGASAYIELEALGLADDVVVPSAAELAHREKVRLAPQEPELVLKPTWHETMIASRESSLAWESMQDKLASFQSAVEFGPWYLLGPLPEKSDAAGKIREATRIDYLQERLGEDGQPLRWQRRDDLDDWQLHELDGFRAADKPGVIFLCRDMDFVETVEKNELAMFVTGDQAKGTLLPQRQRFSISSPAGLVRGSWEVAGPPGLRQMLIELKPDADGRCRLGCLPQMGTVRPGGGDANRRRGRQAALFAKVRQAFPSPVDQAQIAWEEEDEIWLRRGSREAEGWLPGCSEAYLRPAYQAATRSRLDAVAAELAREQGVRAEALGTLRERIGGWLEGLRAGLSPSLTAGQWRAKDYQLATVQQAIALAGQVRSLGLSVADQQAMFGDRYLRAADYQKQIGELQTCLNGVWDVVLSEDPAAMTEVLDLRERIESQSREILLATPLLKFDKLLLAEGGAGFASNWGGANRIGNRMVTLSPVSPDGQLTTIYSGAVSSMDLHWDGGRILFSDGRIVREIHADGTELRQVTPDDGLLRYDPCYLPDGNIVFVSNACQQAVPCTGEANVGNLHLAHADGSDEHRVTFDQDHNWNPTVMHDGRVLYGRWEYTDTPHYFSRLLFRMNPDGTGQMEYYGSNSYWPNATYWPRPIPGHPTLISCVVSGHHGVSRAGELVLLDPARGRHEADGAVQKIPGYGQPVEPVMIDQLVTEVWPKFAAPYPLAEPETNLGAGKYFLACVQRNAWSDWELCLVDVFDNITRIADGRFMSPIPLRPRPQPPVIPSRVDPERKDAVLYLADVYRGPGLQGFPRGSITRLRIGTHHYRYFGNGDTRASSMEGGWDVKRILGTVPVNEDGSALFRVPANTPVFVQPLDAEGKAQQVMRSWYTAMPGETAACIGCHERQNDGPPSQYTVAALARKPAEIEPWHGPMRGFSFEREVQPLLDRRCAGCHNGQPYDNGRTQTATIDLRAKRLHEIEEARRGSPDPAEGLDRRSPKPSPETASKTKSAETDYSPAYLALQQYVRRPGFESDYHMPKPAEYEADTSPLAQLLKKGHYNVQLTPEEWEQLYVWIDYNVPYPVNWRESHRPPTDEQVATRAKYLQQYASIEDHNEDPVPLPPIGSFEPPAPLPLRPQPLELAGWPLGTEEAAKLQQALDGGPGLLEAGQVAASQPRTGPIREELELGDGVTIKLALIPAGRFVIGSVQGADNELPQAEITIDRPFYLGRFEVTNAQFALFDPQHDSGVINERWKDRSRRGTPINQPDAPVVRITWYRAMAFCEWLSDRTGLRCMLPTEAQWEWACRAGTATDFNVGDYHAGLNPFANIADEGIRGWNHGRAERGYNDGLQFSAPGGRFAPNAWGLYDMHGNVAEWCRTTYRPYPYTPRDGRDDPSTSGPKVVRGGSWNDTLRDATSASRWRYEPYKPVYNVGFRVAIERESPAVDNTVAASR